MHGETRNYIFINIKMNTYTYIRIYVHIGGLHRSNLYTNIRTSINYYVCVRAFVYIYKYKNKYKYVCVR